MEDKDCLEILFIRHAQTQYDDIGDRDPSDGELTAIGEKQCNELGEKLKDVQIDAYISSSLLRAFKTAAGVCKAKAESPVIEICPELVECGCTPGYYGCSEEYLNRYYKNTKMCEKLFATEEYEFGCELFEDNCARAQKVVDYIKEHYGFGKRVAVFSHHGMLEYLIPTAIGAKPHSFRFALDNVSITAVDINQNGAAVLRCVNK
ncbi:MAG: histidine phosphatase family protein [Clostridia bacterium]|nr:histidine phosphatase family protein [Clostridia bacterium]